MSETTQLALLILGSTVFGLGVGAQVITHRVRRHWARAGMGITEVATGLASLTAIPVIFPHELETARSSNAQLAVVVMRRFTEHPEWFGKRLAESTRAHETGWRIDYDSFAATLVIENRNEAVLAASRLARAACGEESIDDLRIGIAICPEDAVDMLDAIDVANRRMRGFSHLESVAAQLRELDDRRESSSA